MVIGCNTLTKYFEILYGVVPKIDTTALIGWLFSGLCGLEILKNENIFQLRV